MSLARIAAKQSPPKSRILSGKRALNGGHKRSGLSLFIICDKSCKPTIDTENSVLGVCSEDPIGSIDIEPSGGQPFSDGNYVYAWSASNGGIIPSGQVSNQDLTGLNPGDYTLILFDDSGCSPYQETFSIASLDEISVEINVVEDVV